MTHFPLTHGNMQAHSFKTQNTTEILFHLEPLFKGHSHTASLMNDVRLHLFGKCLRVGVRIS